MMRLALRLARRAAGRTSPNPLVGAVLVRGGRIVGKGYHRFAGGDHAEIAALKEAGAKARGATLYITLEPCSHQGRTPPCSLALIRAGIVEVIAAARDPNPQVSGRGLRQLRRAGISVRVGLEESEGRELIKPFGKFITTGLPFVTLKLAATLDGKIATASGDARWISGPRSRRRVHRMRNEADAIVVGSGTVRADDPQLTCRVRGGRNPLRVVLASSLRLDPGAKIFHQRDPEKTVVATGPQPSPRKVRAIESLGAQVWRLPLLSGQISWRALLRKLASSGAVSVMIEGGAAVAASALKANVVDRAVFFYAPKLLGGDGKDMIAKLGRRRVRQAIGLRGMRVERVGDDIWVAGDPF